MLSNSIRGRGVVRNHAVTGLLQEIGRKASGPGLHVERGSGQHVGLLTLIEEIRKVANGKPPHREAGKKKII